MVLNKISELFKVNCAAGGRFMRVCLLLRGSGQKEDADTGFNLCCQVSELLSVHTLKILTGQDQINVVFLEDVNGLKRQRGGKYGVIFGLKKGVDQA